MKKENSDIHQAIHDSGLFYWQVALEYGLNDGNFSRTLRKELSAAKKAKILEIIQNSKNTRSKLID
ncbi:hypothetical protein V7157_20185 [Neobacillus drentensis]|uniref:hypothetical protein n=1 Tax=Neobacillus drentensis TaxID=220684 RepID=UPI003002642D